MVELQLHDQEIVGSNPASKYIQCVTVYWVVWPLIQYYALYYNLNNKKKKRAPVWEPNLAEKIERTIKYPLFEMSHHKLTPTISQIISYKVQAPFTATWKSEEALTEIDAFAQRLEQIKIDVVTFEVEKLLDGFQLKGRFLETCPSNALFTPKAGI